MIPNDDVTTSNSSSPNGNACASASTRSSWMRKEREDALAAVRAQLDEEAFAETWEGRLEAEPRRGGRAPLGEADEDSGADFDGS